MTIEEKLDLILAQQSEILELLRPKKKNRDTRPAVRFEEWWAAYPKKINKAGCKEKWRSRKLDELADIIISDTKTRRIYDAKWKEGYIPNSTTYLNQSRWESEIETRTRSPKTKAAADAIFGYETDIMDMGEAGSTLWCDVDESDIGRSHEQDNASRVGSEALRLSGPGHHESSRWLDGEVSADATSADRKAQASQSNAPDLFGFTEAEI